MQSSSHYSPLNCSSSTYFDVLSLRYSELCRAMCLCGESPNDSSVGCKGGKKNMPLKSIQVRKKKKKVSQLPKTADIRGGMMKLPSWQVNAQGDNCKTGGMKRSCSSRGQRAPRMSYYLRQVSHRPFPQNISWRAAVSRSVSHRKGRAGRNNYPVKWVPRCGEHGLNKPSGGGGGRGGGGGLWDRKPIASYKRARRGGFFFFSFFLNLRHVLRLSAAHNWKRNKQPRWPTRLL